MNTGTPFSKLTKICIDWWSKFFFISVQSEHYHAGRQFFFFCFFFFVGVGGEFCTVLFVGHLLYQ